MARLAFAVVTQSMLMIVAQASLIQEQALSQEGNGKIHGVVVDSQGAGFRGVGVTITHQATHTEYSKRSDTNGGYDFTNLPSGSYDVLFQAPPTPMPYKMLKISSIEVIAGKSTDLKSQMQISNLVSPIEGVAMTAPRPSKGDISGVALNAQRVGMMGVDVTLVIASPSNLERKTRTDSEGAYRFIDLAPGKYEIRLNGKGFCSISVFAKVVAGKTAKLKMRLETCQPNGAKAATPTSS